MSEQDEQQKIKTVLYLPGQPDKQFRGLIDVQCRYLGLEPVIEIIDRDRESDTLDTAALTALRYLVSQKAIEAVLVRRITDLGYDFETLGTLATEFNAAGVKVHILD